MKKQPVAALQVEYRTVSQLREDPRNARVHSGDQVDALARSLKEFGWTNPILIDDEMQIIAGHGRVLAARQLGMDQVPTIRLSHLSPLQRRAYVLADNRLAELAGWDDALLKMELGDLINQGLEVETVGFSREDMALLTGAMAELESAPESVQENVVELAEMKASRRSQNDELSQKRDTEHYLVIVYVDRHSRERAVVRLGLPADERYVSAESVDIRPRLSKGVSISGERPHSAAQIKHSGAAG